MKKLIYSFNTKQKPKLSEVGGKALSLILTAQEGLPVPDGFVLTVEFFENWLNDVINLQEWKKAVRASDKTRKKYLDAVKKKAMNFKFSDSRQKELKKAIKGFKGKLMAVRSSSPEEDLEGASFAGGYETSLGVTEKTLEKAVKKSFISCLDERIYVYKKEHGFNASKPSIAVIAQEQIASEVSGVAFSINPLNNDHDEAMINANFGLGETVVSGQVTPDTFVVNKAKKKIIKETIGDKDHALFLKKEGGTQKQKLKVSKPSLSKKQILEVAELVGQVEKFYEKPMDIEWAYAGGKLYLLQGRPITAYQPEWTTPYKDFLYARASIVELLPDPLSPLFETMAGPAIGKTMIDIIMELMPKAIKITNPKTLKFVTINGYGYYAMKFSAWDMLSLMLRSLPLYGMLIKGLTLKSWKEVKRPNYLKNIKKWKRLSLKKLSAKELVKAVEELTYATISHYTAVQAVLPVIYMSEGIMAKYYNKLIKRKNDPPSQNFVMGYDSVPIRADKSLYDIAVWSKKQKSLKNYLSKTPADKVPELLRKGAVPRGINAKEWKEWQKKFKAHLENFGHVIYDLDFMKAVSADHPDPLFDTMKFYMQGKGHNPYKRQEEMVKQRERDVNKILKRIGPIRRWAFKKLLKVSQDYAPIREDGLADVALAWPLVREMLFELGQRLKRAKALKDKEDIFWLKEKELAASVGKLDRKSKIKSFMEKIEERKEIWNQQRKLTPLVMYPEDYRFFGFKISAFLPKTKQEGKNIEGIGASQGKVTGVARVILSPDEFHLMQPGEILVTAITTPAWTPLFAIASGIVTDVGGPLSHSSIVAREYGVPAVLGTGMASKMIKSGQVVTVDGDEGIITLQ